MKSRLLCATTLCAALVSPIAALAAEGFATANVNMRSGPSTGYPAVTVIPAGAPLEINGCLAEIPWCDVSFFGGRGWVAGRYVQALYQQRRVYVGPEYYAPLGIPTIGFDLDNYWDRYYRGRDFYRDRGRWRQEGGWGDRRDNVEEYRPGPDSRRRPDGNADWDRRPDRNPDWNARPDRGREGNGRRDGNPDWNNRPDGNPQAQRPDNARNRPDNARNRPDRQPDRPRDQPPGAAPDVGPYSPGYVPPPGPGGYSCDNRVSDCGPPARRGSNR